MTPDRSFDVRILPSPASLVRAVAGQTLAVPPTGFIYSRSEFLLGLALP
jgi:hypothetical protein